MTTQTKAAELAEKLEQNLDRDDFRTVIIAKETAREAAALLRASEGWVPDAVCEVVADFSGPSVEYRIGKLFPGIEALEHGSHTLYAAPHLPAQQAEPDVLPAPDEKKLCAAITEHILSSDAAGIPAVSRQDFRAGVDFARRYYASPPPHKAEGAEPADTKRLNWLRDNSCDLRCFDMPTGAGDADIGWRVIEHHMAKPHERVVGEAFEDDPRKAIDAARHHPGAQRMTDRIHSITVVLTEDTRDDDVKPLIDAILMLKGVCSVSTHVSDFNSHMAEQRARMQIGEQLLSICFPKIKDTA